MRICHIGVVSFESKVNAREPKAIGGIPGYIYDLITYSLSINLAVIFVGKIYNFEKRNSFIYHQIQNQLSSTNNFLLHLFFKSIFIGLTKDTLIHAHRPDHLAAFILTKKNPSVITLHGQQARTINIRKGIIIRTIYNILEKYALKRATYLIAVDNKTKDFYSTLYPSFYKKIITIPTGVDTNLFKPLDKLLQREKLKLNSNDNIILYVGRIEPPKRIKEMIEAFEIVLKKSTNYKLILVGDGTQLNAIRDIVIKIKLSEAILFWGVRSKSELPSIYNAADITVLYSGNEGSPLSVKESLACGVPVVANDVGDISDIIIDGMNGYIVKKETPAALADCLLKCIGKSLEMKEDCINSITNFKTEKVSAKVIDLYKKALNV